MNIVSKVSEWSAIRKELQNKTLGFVPTMGNLHAGHRSLCQRSKMENEITAVSIFVNPTQFNQVSDFELYPRTLEKDKEILLAEKVDYLFLPDDLYPDQFEVQVTETAIARELEGEFRPGHFSGMLTVVLKLLNLMQATHAYFGEKDYQQLLLVKKMVTALFIPTAIVACETIRGEGDLALSSRNSRLNPEQLKKAQQFPQWLQKPLSVTEITEQLKLLGFEVDYIVENWQRRLGAVWIDGVRLIDNFPITRG